MLCISTSKRVLCTLFAAQNYLFQSFNENWCNYISKKNSSSCFRVPAMHEPGSKFIKYLANFQVLEAPKRWSKYTGINPSIHPSVCPSLHPFICPSVRLSVCLCLSLRFQWPFLLLLVLVILPRQNWSVKFFSQKHIWRMTNIFFSNFSLTENYNLAGTFWSYNNLAVYLLNHLS